MKTINQKTIYINFYDEIDMKKIKSFIDFCCKSIEIHKPDVIYFLFASPGGNVSAGIILYNFLRTIPQKVIMHNIGSVDSIGTVVFLGAEERYAMPHTTFLFHGVETNFKNQEKMNIKKVEEIKNGLLEDQERIASIVSENCSISKKEMQALFVQGETKSAKFAKEKSFIHEIKNIILKKHDIFLNFTNDGTSK